jgi:hypothetical protein
MLCSVVYVDWYWNGTAKERKGEVRRRTKEQQVSGCVFCESVGWVMVSHCLEGEQSRAGGGAVWLHGSKDTIKRGAVGCTLFQWHSSCCSQNSPEPFYFVCRLKGLQGFRML